MSKQKVTVHCSASAFGNSALLDSWHRKKSMNKVAYQLVILNGRIDSKFSYDSFYDGLIETGRHFKEQGAHVRGHNKDNIGICLIGESGNFTKTQLIKLDQVLLILKSRHGSLDIKQHSDYDPINKSFCAGLDDGYMKRLQQDFE